MEQVFNTHIWFLFIGGLFSLLLTIVILIARQEHKRYIERGRLEEARRANPEGVGDIEAKLDDTPSFRSIDIPAETTKWGIQPLLIISFISLFDQSSTLEIICAFCLVLVTILHEFYLADRFASNMRYQIFIGILWLFFFCMLSYKANDREKTQHALPQSGVPKSTDTTHHKQPGDTSIT
ncbi:MAG: hypothetical protein V4450_17480 [Bacteroidota bacterium]